MTHEAEKTDKYHGHPRFFQLLKQMAELHSAKNHDYTDGRDPFLNFRKAEAIGLPAWQGVLVRMGDKFSRLENFAKRGNSGAAVLHVANETVQDTFLDLAVYALIGLVLFEERDKRKEP